MHVALLSIQQFSVPVVARMEPRLHFTRVFARRGGMRSSTSNFASLHPALRVHSVFASIESSALARAGHCKTLPDRLQLLPRQFPAEDFAFDCHGARAHSWFACRRTETCALSGL